MQSEKLIKSRQKKTLSLALSGCSGRAIAYIGILEVLQENGIKVDSIAACSSASFVACAYAAGSLDKLKEMYFTLRPKEIYGYLEPSFKGGLFSFDKARHIIESLVSAQNLEELNIPVALVASDIVHGEEVDLLMGDIFRAIKASCAMPGIFEPVVWGNKILVDGGILSIVPIDAARKFNNDIIIGVDLAKSRLGFNPYLLHIRRGYNFVAFPFKKINSLAGKIKTTLVGEPAYGQQLDMVKIPSMANVLSRSMDHAILEKKKPEKFDCDLMLEPDVKKFGKMDSGNFETMYLEGRRTAEQCLPRILELLK